MSDFNATTPQAKFKAKLYAAHPNCNPLELTPQQLQTMTGNRSVVRWCTEEGFLEWLAEKDTVKRLLDAASETAVKRLLDIVAEDSIGPQGRVTAASQVAAAKLILEFAGFSPPNHKIVEYRDKDINEMSAKELREFVNKNLKLVAIGD